MSQQKESSLVKEVKLTSSGVLLPIMSALTAIILIFLVLAFFKGWTFNFYANILFGFYALTKQIWISVILLGVTQTLIMVPFRMIRVMQSQNIQKFQEKIVENNAEAQQIAKVKKTFRRGNLTFLFYLIDFMVQLTLFISIGRLFLTDFYSQPLDSSVLVSFIPYPQYPLRGLIFRLPYPVVTNAKDFGLWAVFGLWALIILGHVFFYLFKRFSHRFQQEDQVPKKETASSPKQALGYLGSSTAILFLISYWLVRHFPLALTIIFFSGNVSQPNRTLNLITAIVTFLMFFWFGLQDLLRKGKLAQQKGIPEAVVEATQKEMFREALFNSALTGLGAYLITNLIPSAFELSIFTFELIAILSPLTIDKFVVKLTKLGEKKEPSSEASL